MPPRLALNTVLGTQTRVLALVCTALSPCIWDLPEDYSWRDGAGALRNQSIQDWPGAWQVPTLSHLLTHELTGHSHSLVLLLDNQ